MTMTKRNIPADSFDPADQVGVVPTKVEPDGSVTVTGTGELLNEDATTSDMYTPDTNGDPVGSETRSSQDEVRLPAFYYDRYALDSNGNPIPKPSVVAGIMEIVREKSALFRSFEAIKSDKAKQKAVDEYQQKITAFVDGYQPLLEVDMQGSGLNLVQLVTKTWAEFASVAYEYQMSADALDGKDMPDWLAKRETQAVLLFNKATFLNEVTDRLSHLFELNEKTMTVKQANVQKQVEYRQQRLAEYNFKKHGDTSNRNATSMNEENANFARQLIANLA